MKLSQSLVATVLLTKLIATSSGSRDLESALDLTYLLSDIQIPRTEIFNHALTIINVYETGPSCARVAAVDLIDGCHDLEVADPKNTNVALDQIKSGFAARLAVCELEGARVKVPKACSYLKTLTSCNKNSPHHGTGQRASSFCFDTLMLSECLRALASTPQSWTSYSNNHQNAVTICNSVRHEVEMDEAIDIYRTMVTTNSDMTNALTNTLRMHQESLIREADFIHAVQNMQFEVNKDLELEAVKAKGLLNSIFKNAEAGITSMFEKIFSHANAAAESLHILSSKLDESTSEFSKLQQSMQDAANQNLGSVTTMSSSLSNVHTQVNDAVAMYGSMNSQMAVFTGLINGLQGEIQDIKGDLSGLRTALSVTDAAFQLHSRSQQEFFDASLAQIQAGHTASEQIITNLAVVNNFFSDIAKWRVGAQISLLLAAILVTRLLVGQGPARLVFSCGVSLMLYMEMPAAPSASVVRRFAPGAAQSALKVLQVVLGVVLLVCTCCGVFVCVVWRRRAAAAAQRTTGEVELAVLPGAAVQLQIAQEMAAAA